MSFSLGGLSGEFLDGTGILAQFSTLSKRWHCEHCSHALLLPGSGPAQLLGADLTAHAAVAPRLFAAFSVAGCLCPRKKSKSEPDSVQAAFHSSKIQFLGFWSSFVF